MDSEWTQGSWRGLGVDHSSFRAELQAAWRLVVVTTLRPAGQNRVQEPDQLWVREEGWINLKGTFWGMVALL